MKMNQHQGNRQNDYLDAWARHSILPRVEEVSEEQTNPSTSGIFSSGDDGAVSTIANEAVNILMESELERLLQCFDLLSKEGMSEIITRVDLKTLSDLNRVIRWEPIHWVRHLGTGKSSILKETTFLISCLKYLDGFPELLDGNSLIFNSAWLDEFAYESQSRGPFELWVAAVDAAIREELQKQGPFLRTQRTNIPDDTDKTRDTTNAPRSEDERSQNVSTVFDLTHIDIPRNIDGEVDIATVDTSSDESGQPVQEPWKRRVLRMLLLLNFVSILLTIKHGFGVDYASFVADIIDKIFGRTDQPTSSPITHVFFSAVPTMSPHSVGKPKKCVCNCIEGNTFDHANQTIFLLFA